jgi:hypothetical protein
MILIAIVGEDSFHSFDPVVRSKLQFRGLNLIRKLDDRFKKLIGVIEYTTSKKCLDMGEKLEIGWCQVGTVWRMRNSNESISLKAVLMHSKCMDFPSLRKDFRRRRIHNMSMEVPGVEIPPGGITPTTRNPSIFQITVNKSFSC